MPKPHGGKLVERLLPAQASQDILAQAAGWPRLYLNEERAFEAYNLATGLYSPLEGFMGPEDLRRVVQDMRLSNDLPWTIPIILDVTQEQAEGFKEGQDLLLYADSTPLAVMHLEEKYTYDKAELAARVYGTTDPTHPGVAQTAAMKEVLLRGPVSLLQEPPDPFSRYRLTPRETRVLFKTKGWETVVGFQTRNVPHLGHEYVQKTALSFVDGLFVNPVIGRKKAGDFKDEVILRSYEVLMDKFYPRNRAVMGIWRTEMRYAGPREAIFHAIVRKNFGCTHFIVGRDHAGVGSFYSPYAAQEIFQEFPDLGITPLFFTAFFYCRECGSVTNEKTCPHEPGRRVEFSGTRIRRALTEGGDLPTELLRPEIAQVTRGWDNPLVG